MTDLALYRKYRSGNFAQVIGQDHVVRSLTGALASGQLRHAYLFTGPRGVGKTSVARLLARALNCTGEPKPCNECSHCLTGINSSLDIVEMDAASNRSIDSIRDLREKISLAPSSGKFKVYIIDEVHMLTTEAFNALLKTLEEPPAHAVFILATTEAHKLPETIISRTQVFNFKPITTPDLISHLSDIAAKEHIDIAPGALDIIAESSRGGFRDAISLLDQLASGKTGETITPEHARDLLGYSNTTEIHALSDALAQNDTQACLQVTDRLFTNGAQAGIITTQLVNHWRRILLVASRAATATDPNIERLATLITPARAAHIIASLLEVARSSWPQLALETILVRLTAPAAAPTPIDQAPAPSNSTQPPVPKRSLAGKTAPPEPTNPRPTSTPPPHTTTPTPADSQLWPKVLTRIKGENNSLGALLQMYPVDFAEDEIIVKPRFNFHRDLFIKPTNRTIIEAAAAKVYGRTIKVSARTEDNTRSQKRAVPDPAAELISSALEILGGEVVE